MAEPGKKSKNRTEWLFNFFRVRNEHHIFTWKQESWKTKKTPKQIKQNQQQQQQKQTKKKKKNLQKTQANQRGKI